MEQSVAEALGHAEHLFRANRLEEMEHLCGTILEATPRSAEAHRFLGLAAYARGRYEEAAEQARRAVAIAPSDAAAYDNLSLFLAAQGRPVEAEAAARQALAIHPRYGQRPRTTWGWRCKARDASRRRSIRCVIPWPWRRTTPTSGITWP